MAKSKKKITRVDGKSSSEGRKESTYEITDEKRAKAKQFRLIAALLWLIAIGFEIWAIVLLQSAPVNMTLLITFIVIDLLFAVAGILLWKKSNRLNPASEKEKFKFFIQNQLGVIIAMIAFLPLVILIFTNKNLSGKQKGIAGSIAVVALLVAGIFGVDLNPPSQEEYQEKLEQEQSNLESGFDGESVYWTKSGKSFHLYSDCSYINGVRTDEIFQGTKEQAKELKSITDACDRCLKRSMKTQEEYDASQEMIPEETNQTESEE